MKAIPNIFHVLAIFLEYPLRTVWGIVPVLLAAWSILSFSGCGACGTARNGALSYTTDSSWDFFTLTEKPAEVHSCEHAQCDQGKLLRFMCLFFFFFSIILEGFKHVLLPVDKCCIGWGKVLQDVKAGSHLWHCCGCSCVTSVPQQEDFVLQVQERHGQCPNWCAWVPPLSLVSIRLPTGCYRGAGKSLKRRTQF